MSITIGDKPEQNVVNVGDEISSAQLAAIQNATGASATNFLLTKSEAARRFARRAFQTNGALLSTQITGTGAGYTQVQQYTVMSAGSAGVAGFARGYCLVYQPVSSGVLDWTRPIGFSSWVRLSNNSAFVGHNWRCGVGYTSSPTAGVAVGDFSERGFGFYWSHGGNVLLQVHDGTTLRTVDTGYTPPSATTSTQVIYVEAFSDGLGNVSGILRAVASGVGGAITEYAFSSSNGPAGAIGTATNNGYLNQIQSLTTHTTGMSCGGMHPVFFYE